MTDAPSAPALSDTDYAHLQYGIVVSYLRMMKAQDVLVEEFARVAGLAETFSKGLRHQCLNWARIHAVQRDNFHLIAAHHMGAVIRATRSMSDEEAAVFLRSHPMVDGYPTDQEMDSPEGQASRWSLRLELVRDPEGSIVLTPPKPKDARED